MKTLYTIPLTFCLFLTCFALTAQEKTAFQTQYEPIYNELKAWDNVRGEWLANSIQAHAEKNPVPDRMFPENFTPFEMYKKVPLATRERIQEIANSNNRADQVEWQRVNRFVNSVSCSSASGRTYGDPHLSSFDGARYSFQTVGEFVLAKNDAGTMEVQSRQKAMSEDFSLNTAVAMNVSGDRVCLYAEDVPDGDQSTPIRLNGTPVHIGNKPYFLPNGGTISLTGGKYLIDWPTGETVVADFSRNNEMDFINITVQIIDCAKDTFTGLLGNSNNVERDDFEVGGNQTAVASIFIDKGPAGEIAEEIERERQMYLSREFAENFRITMSTTLFDYGLGLSTLSYTDRSFPKYHRSLRDINVADRDVAKRNCERAGISGRDLDGCIFDQAFVKIDPAPPVVINDRTKDVEFTNVIKPTPNTNPTPDGNIYDTGAKPETFEPETVPTADPISKPTGGTELIPDVKEEPVKPSTPKTTPDSKPKVVMPRPDVPMPKPSPAPKPLPTPKPTPKPVPVPKPAPAPKPAPTPTPVPKTGTVIKGR